MWSNLCSAYDAMHASACETVLYSKCLTVDNVPPMIFPAAVVNVVVMVLLYHSYVMWWLFLF